MLAWYPENLRFGICWQRDESESLDPDLNDYRFLPKSGDSAGNWLISAFDPELADILLPISVLWVEAKAHHRQLSMAASDPKQRLTLKNWEFVTLNKSCHSKMRNKDINDTPSP